MNQQKRSSCVNEVSGREAAYGEVLDEELCCDLAGKFARESARRTEAKEIGSIRDNYEAIVFIRARSLSVVLRNETNQAQGDFLRKLGRWIGDYASCCIHGEEGCYNWTLSGHTVSKELLSALAEEYVRDRHGLMQFLEDVFKRWRKIDQPGSLWRVKSVTQQHLGKPKVVAQYLENIGAVSKCTNKSHSESLRARIRQYCSRDRRSALVRQLASVYGYSPKRILLELQECGAIPKKLSPASRREWISKIKRYLCGKHHKARVTKTD